MELRERLLSVHRFDGVITRIPTATITDQAPAFIKGIPQRHRGIGQGGADIAVDIVNFRKAIQESMSKIGRSMASKNDEVKRRLAPSAERTMFWKVRLPSRSSSKYVIAPPAPSVTRPATH